MEQDAVKGMLPPAEEKKTEKQAPVWDILQQKAVTAEPGIPLWRQAASFLCAKNPFYLISALLIIYAQSALFTSNPLMGNTELPAAILAAYTVLLAAAGVLIVRVGKVWEDARSVLLLVLVLLQVLPVGIDGLLLNEPGPGRLWMAGVFMLSLCVSEILRRGLNLKIGLWTGMAYYGFIALICAWPVFLAKLVQHYEQNNGPVALAILLFPILAGFFLIFLIPTIRRGEAGVRDNGTPWRWPYFPLSAFAVIIAGVAFRAYLMTISFVGGKGAGPYSSLESGFQLWMLTPLLFGIGFLLIENASLSKNAKVSFFACSVPFIVLIFCIPFNQNPATEIFRNALPGSYSPFELALPMILAYLAWGCFRGVVAMGKLFHAALILFAVLGLSAQADQESFSFLPGWIPSAFLSGEMLVMAWLRRHSAYSFIAGLTAIFCFASVCQNMNDVKAGLIAFAFLLNFYLNGAIFHDSLAKVLGRVAAAFIPVYLLFAMIALKNSHLSDKHFYFVLVGLGVLLLMTVLGIFFIDRKDYWLIFWIDAAILAFFGVHSCRYFFNKVFLSLKNIFPLLASLFALAFAVGISLYKGRRRRRNEQTAA